jgi:hypothetical protein
MNRLTVPTPPAEGFEIHLPPLHPAQQEIIDHPARFKVLSCGRRFGKTQTALELIVSHLLEGHAVAYFAPSHIMTGEVWEKVKRTLAPVISRVKENDSRIELLNGAVFECWTARTEAVRGRTYHFVVIDEAALLPDASVWHAAIRPLLTDYRGGALFASTPRGRNWFWQLYNIGQQNDIKDWQSWTFPTTANPHIDPLEIEGARDHLPERVFKQEYLAAFLEDGGSVFRGIDNVCIAQPQREAEIGKTYVFGVDWGKNEDFTCISIIDNTGTQVCLDRFNQISYNIQRDRLKTLIERFNPILILAEANSIGAVNIDALQADGLPVRPFYTTAQSKAPLIEGLALAIERASITLLNDANLIHELQAYEMSRTPTGMWQYNAPLGAHDDTVIATALSYWAHNHYRAPSFDFV